MCAGCGSRARRSLGRCSPSGKCLHRGSYVVSLVCSILRPCPLGGSGHNRVCLLRDSETLPTPLSRVRLIEKACPRIWKGTQTLQTFEGFAHSFSGHSLGILVSPHTHLAPHSTARERVLPALQRAPVGEDRVRSHHSAMWSPHRLSRDSESI